jgi:hypothetical protein
LKPVELFHIGPQKAAHTWVYTCMREHPGVFCPAEDCLFYFDMFYSRGRDWYARFFEGAGEHQKLFDPTPSYIRSSWAPARIAQENPRARIVLCLRNPIERAFSHYWQERKRDKTGYDFAAVFTNYDLFASWLEPGFYAQHIERYLRHFDREQMLCQIFDDLDEDPHRFLVELLTFAGVDPTFEPSVLRKRVNEASPHIDPVSIAANKMRLALERVGMGRLIQRSRRASIALSGKTEYARGISPELYADLLQVCEPEIARVEALLGVDLSAWRTHVPAAAGGTRGC